MPWLEYVGNDFVLRPADNEIRDNLLGPDGEPIVPGDMGIQGKVGTDDESWSVTPGYKKGGELIVEYTGDIEAGRNPGFSLFVTTYAHGQGIYSNVPEGSVFEIRSYVEYDMYAKNGNDWLPDSAWETENRIDVESRVNLIATDLDWEASFDIYPEDAPVFVPIWDRYQYIDYLYTIENLSENPEAKIDGFTFSLEMDTIIDPGVGNGIFRSDVLRWKYDPDNPSDPIFNPGVVDAGNDKYMGVPDEGGVLIYDVTGWDGTVELTNEYLATGVYGDPLPYSVVSNAIEVDQETSLDRRPIHPEDANNAAAPAKRQYFVSLPMSRQGFPNLPYPYRINYNSVVLLAQDQHWSKRDTTDREVVAPTYGFDFEHTTKQSPVVYGFETYNEINEILGIANANAPTREHNIDYEVVGDGKGFFYPTKITYEYDLKDDPVFYYLDVTHPEYDPDHPNIGKTPKVTWADGAETATPTREVSDPDPDTGDQTVTLTFDVSALGNALKNDPNAWDSKFNFFLAGWIDPIQEIPVSIKVYGEPHKVMEDMTFEATLNFNEFYAINEDLEQDTSYTDVTHSEMRKTKFDVIFPNEAFPEIELTPKADDPVTNNPFTINYGDRADIEYSYGFQEIAVGTTTKTTLKLNGYGNPADGEVDDALSDIVVTVKDTLFDAVLEPEEIVYKWTTIGNDTVVIDPTDPTTFGTYETDNDGNVIITPPAGMQVKDFIIETGIFESEGKEHFVTVTAKVENGWSPTYKPTATFEVYQALPYNKTNDAEAEGLINIKTPIELEPNVQVVGVYGDLKTPINTNVSYESRFDVEYQLGTGLFGSGGANAREYTYKIHGDEPTGDRSHVFHELTLQPEFLTNLDQDNPAHEIEKITFTDASGVTKTVTRADWIANPTVTFADVQAGSGSGSISNDIREIVISGENLKLENLGALANTAAGRSQQTDVLQTIVVVTYDAELDMGESQKWHATFNGKQDRPFQEPEHDKTATRNNNITVFDATTKVKIEGVKQVERNLGVENEYDVAKNNRDIKLYYYWYSTNGSVHDYTLDMGYKAIGGFNTTLTRPKAEETYGNNDQTTTIDVALPHEHFDLYYLKLRPELKDHVEKVEIYRYNKATGQESAIPHTVNGSAWTNSSQSAGFWRLGTAIPGNNNTHYKDPWANNVHPDNPVSRVVITLKFDRADNNAAPQLAGITHDAVEFMGRFYKVSDKKYETEIKSKDVFGVKNPIQRLDELDRSINRTPAHNPGHPFVVNSLVQNPYAQSKTGAHIDGITPNTSKPSQDVLVGEEGFYIASVQNLATEHLTSHGYRGHGPDIYVNVNSEYDEWLGQRDTEAFHDKMIYEFVYPASPNTPHSNPNRVNDHYLTPTNFTISKETNNLKYVSKVVVYGDDDTEVTLNLGATRLNADTEFIYDNTRSRGITSAGSNKYYVSFGPITATDPQVYPERFEVTFEKIAGLGDNSAEIDGHEPDSMGTDLKEVDIKVGGLVNGNQELVGTTNLYRVLDEGGKADENYCLTPPTGAGNPSKVADEQCWIHTSSAILKGYTPILNAAVDMQFDNTRVFDYKVDGLTPNETELRVSLKNNRNGSTTSPTISNAKSEADIHKANIIVTPDSAFRSTKVEIPAEIFYNPTEWALNTVILKQGTGNSAKTITLDLSVSQIRDQFTLRNGKYALDLRKFFDSTYTSNLNLGETFEIGELKPTAASPYPTPSGSHSQQDPLPIEADIKIYNITSLEFQFASNDPENVRMWGSFARDKAALEPTPRTLRYTMQDLPDTTAEPYPGDVLITGIWVDHEVNQSGAAIENWQSKPSFRSEYNHRSDNVYYSRFSSNATIWTPQKYTRPKHSNYDPENFEDHDEDHPWNYREDISQSKTGSNSNAPTLSTRRAAVTTTAWHLDNEYNVNTTADRFYDKQTGKQIHYQNVAVEDTVRVLYEIKNNGELGTLDDKNAPGNLPVINPAAYIQVPKGLRISDLQVEKGFFADKGTDTDGNDLKGITASGVNIDGSLVKVMPSGPTETDKRYDIIFGYKGKYDVQQAGSEDIVLDFGEKLYIYVEFTTINDFVAEANRKLTDTQGKGMYWYFYPRSGYAHQHQSYRVSSTTSSRPGITSNSSSYSDNSTFEGKTTHYGYLYNNQYVYANPSRLRITSNFDIENISGETMTLEVQNIENEILHDDTLMDLYLTLDNGTYKTGFELTEFPEPQYPTGFDGEFGVAGNKKPKVHYWYLTDPADQNSGAWFDSANFATSGHDMKEINELWVEYGTVPARNDWDDGKTVFTAPNFKIKGIGHWQSITAGSDAAKTTKNYTIRSVAEIQLTHKKDTPVSNPGDPDYNAEDNYADRYVWKHEATRVVWKAMPQLEFNIQSFDTLGEAKADYVGEDVGKTSYVAGDEIHYKLTAKNHTAFQGTGTNTALGRGPLLKPIVIDKVPEYLESAILDQKYLSGSDFVNGVDFDITQAIADGVIDIKILECDNLREPEHKDDGCGHTPRDFEMPKVTVKKVTGLDIAGSQQFDGKEGDPINDAQGVLASAVNNSGVPTGVTSGAVAEPVDTDINPADEIEFTVFTYEFENDRIDRGEQLEIVYSTKARTDDLPIATYKNGKSVFAPFFGWYTENIPVANSVQDMSMDMASLLHDAGITGDKGHEMTAEEFLSQAMSWQPGGQRERYIVVSWNRRSTYYDDTANKDLTHKTYLQERTSYPNSDITTLYTSATGGSVDDNYNYASKGRVNDGKIGQQTDVDNPPVIETDERILWAQDGLQLNRAWLYGASEMVPDVERTNYDYTYDWLTHTGDVDAANYYEHDGNLFHAAMSQRESGSGNARRYSPYKYDDYTYAVELHEQFTVKLHAANLGDRDIQSGLVYTEILPVGITPYSASSTAGQTNLLGIKAYDGHGNEITEGVSYAVIQKPDNDKGYRAPNQAQEARTYEDTRHHSNEVPYVVQVTVAGDAGKLQSMFNSPDAEVEDKYQSVEIRVRVEDEVAPEISGQFEDLSLWHDEFILTTIDAEEYLEIYSHEYGGYDYPIDWRNIDRFENHAMVQGIDVVYDQTLNPNPLTWLTGSGNNRYIAVEPWGKYIRGLNAKGTTTTHNGKPDGTPAIVTGDQIAMRKPTLRIWNELERDPEIYSDAYDDSIENFSVNLYEEFTIHSKIENQQLEAMPEYNRAKPKHYENPGRGGIQQDIWENAPQTIGGARGGWFEPVVTIALPHGIAPIVGTGSNAKPARYYESSSSWQNAQFEAAVHKITHDSSEKDTARPDGGDVTNRFNVRVEKIDDPGYGERFVMHFTVNRNRSADIAYGESLVISPRVAVIDAPLTSADNYDVRFQEIVTLANTKRRVFNPATQPINISSYYYQEDQASADLIIADPYHYETGSPVTIEDRDFGVSTYPGTILTSDNGELIAENDRKRLDSMSEWDDDADEMKNEGKLKITERLIGKTNSYQADTEIILSDKLNGNDAWTAVPGGSIATVEGFAPIVNQSKHHDEKPKRGAYGGTNINLLAPSIHNATKVLKLPESAEKDVENVDPSSKYWYLTDVRNGITAKTNPYAEYQSTGEVSNSRFLVTQYITKFVEVTDEVRLKVWIEEDGQLVEKVLNRQATVKDGVTLAPGFEDLGYSVEKHTPFDTKIGHTDEKSDQHGERRRVQWIVTTPAADTRDTYGSLKQGENVKLLYEVKLIDGYDDLDLNEGEQWKRDDLDVDSYISLLPEDTTLRDSTSTGVSIPAEDFIVQGLNNIRYHAHVYEKDAYNPRQDPVVEGDEKDYDNDNGDLVSHFAHDTARIGINKPNGEVRINTARPRLEYSNGTVGEPHFNSVDNIEYLITHAQITGSGLHEFVVETLLPTKSTGDPDYHDVTNNIDFETRTSAISTGKWEIPLEQEYLDKMEFEGKTIDQIFKTFVYISHEEVEAGYEQNDYQGGGWKLLNPGGTSVYENKKLDIDLEDQANLKKVRVVVRSMDSDYVVPTGTRLDVDADPETEDVRENVTETDPDNRSSEAYPAEVIDNVITIDIRAFSDHDFAFFLHSTAQAWGNYVSDKFILMDHEKVRAYLTPASPVTNIFYDSRYYRSTTDPAIPREERYGWSENTTINPEVSPHLKFIAKYINADESMWDVNDVQEAKTYREDLLIDPFISFQLPEVMKKIETNQMEYIPYEDIYGPEDAVDENVKDPDAEETLFEECPSYIEEMPDGPHPLHPCFRSEFKHDYENEYPWTWYIQKADGSKKDPRSNLVVRDFSTTVDPQVKDGVYAGEWPNFHRNVVSVWFEGQLEPGDMVVIELLVEVAEYNATTDPIALTSKAMISNNTGMITQLNSKQNATNWLELGTDRPDFDLDERSNTRFVSAQRTLFSYGSFTNFSKTKRSSSILSPEGTRAPNKAAVEQGGIFTFTTALDNPRARGLVPYEFPLIYDVLPYEDDKTILRPGTNRESVDNAWLIPDEMTLTMEGKPVVDANGDPVKDENDQALYEDVVYDPSDYTIYVGPFKKVEDNGVETIERVDLQDALIFHPTRPKTTEDPYPHEENYEKLGVGGQPSPDGYREERFVELDDITNLPQAEATELFKDARMLLVLFNDPEEEMPGTTRIVFEYQMKSPLNAPGYMEQFDDEEREFETELWNTFMGKHSGGGSLQESNRAGAYATEFKENAYIGNYVWHDINFDGKQNEGTPFIDNNGRTHLRPTMEDEHGNIIDPGINGVKVTLLSAEGFHIDREGNRIVQATETIEESFGGETVTITKEGNWYMADENGDIVLDTEFVPNLATESEYGPMVKYTETDWYGHHGYYTFSNIKPGSYRVMYEFPEEFDDYSITTRKVFEDYQVPVKAAYPVEIDPNDPRLDPNDPAYDPDYDPNEALNAAPAGVNPTVSYDRNRFIAVTDVAAVTLDTTDEERMSFDIGVAKTVKLGGKVFDESEGKIDGRWAVDSDTGDPIPDTNGDPVEPGIEGYYVYLKHLDGTTVKDEEDNDMVVRTDENGDYEFKLLPVDLEYYIEVKDADNSYNTDMLVSPFIWNNDPLVEEQDNDGYNEKGSTVIRSNKLQLSLEELYDTDFADIFKIWFAFYEKSDIGVIGNKVWEDTNRDGLQDENEPGIAGQKLRLIQYVWDETGETWVLRDEFQSEYNNPGLEGFEDAQGNPEEGPYAISNHDGYYYFEDVPAFLEESDGIDLTYTDVKYEVVVDALFDLGYTFTKTRVDDESGNPTVRDSDFYTNGKMHAFDAADPLEQLIDLKGTLNEDEPEDPFFWYGMTDTSIDLGLVPHPLSHIKGEVFMDVGPDNTPDGLKDDPVEEGAEELYTFTLQVWVPAEEPEDGHDPDDQPEAGQWVDVRIDSNGVMIEPHPIDADAPAGEVYKLENVKEYLFENLHLVKQIEAIVSNDGDGDNNAGSDGDGDDDNNGNDEVVKERRLELYQYRVKAQNIPLWQELTALRVGDDTEIDNDFTGWTRDGEHYFLAVTPGEAAANGPLADGAIELAKRDNNHLLKIDTTEGIPEEYADLGLIPLLKEAIIGDYIWEDKNRNGIQNAGEPGIEGVKVTLNRLEGDKLVAIDHTFTDENGLYEFLVPVAGTDPKNTETYNKPFTYVAEFNLTSKQELMAYRQGSDDTVNSKFRYVAEFVDEFGYTHTIKDAEHTVLADPVTLISLEEYEDEYEGERYEVVDYRTTADNRDVDGGVFAHETIRIIGDTVYEDVNKNGVQEFGESGIGGLTVRLFRLDQATQKWVPHTDENGNSRVVTDEDGMYEFAVEIADLDKKSTFYRQTEQYRVLVEAPAHMRLVEINNVFFYQESTNVDGIRITRPYSYILTEPIVLVDSDEEGIANLETARDDLTVDAGLNEYETTVIIAGRAWDDANGDGIQGAKEDPIAEQTVKLWEKLEGVWQNVPDVNEISEVETDENGYYSFEVAPTHYDETDPATFLKPREYLVTVEREGYQEWSPLNVGDDHRVDSDVMPLDETQWSADKHLGLTHVFNIFDQVVDPGVEEDEDDSGAEDGDLENDGAENDGAEGDTSDDSDNSDDSDVGVGGSFISGGGANGNNGDAEEIVYLDMVDITSVRDDRFMDVGIITHPETVVIAGHVWNDVNENGSRDIGEIVLPGQEVVLWESVNGRWQKVADVSENQTQVTDKNGYYQFEVMPTIYDQNDSKYLKQRHYRTTLAMPEGYLLSAESETSFMDKKVPTSVDADIVTLDETGLVELVLNRSDLDLDYPLVIVPEDETTPGEDLTVTGSELNNFWYIVMFIALGGALFAYGMRREQQRQKS